MNLSQSTKYNTSVKYHFSIPDSPLVWVINTAMLQAMQEHPDWFYDDFAIDSCYGCPPGCIWNGNREILGQQLSEEGFEGIVKGYSDFGVKYRLTFTNFLLKKEHLQDRYCNAIASGMNEYGGEVIVSTEMMYSYIENTYPELPITWSTTTDFGVTMPERLKKVNELSAKNMLVLPYDFNNKPVLKDLTHPENIEVLVNEMCIDNCPMRREHERQSNMVNLSGQKSPCYCFLSDKKSTTEWQMHSIISRRGLVKYVTLGVNNFKISGRITVYQALSAYLHYFTRQECWLRLLNCIDDSYRGKSGAFLEYMPVNIYPTRKYLFIDETYLNASFMAQQAYEDCGKENDGLW